MEYKIIGGHLDLKKHHKTIADIVDGNNNNQEKEVLFKKIAKDILKKEGFTTIKEGPTDLKGVPFDFIACKNREFALIELKGATDGFNYSKDVQYSRVQQVLTELKERKIKAKIYLLQINLKFNVYQILTEQFYNLIFKNLDPTKGTKTKNIPIIVDRIIKNKMECN
jgi:hypothetical protein